MNTRATFVLILAAITLLAGTAWSQDVKTRMKERLPIIIALKARGVVGENNQGYLEMLKGQSENKEAVMAENQDRKAVYEEIAQKTGTSMQVVGQRRAIQIAEKAASGEWVQTPAGQWKKK